MKVSVKNRYSLKITANTKPERNLLKFFKKRQPEVSGFSSTLRGQDKQETEVTLFLTFERKVTE